MATEIGGGIAPATKEFDAVATGTLDYAVTCFMYWVDKMPQCGIFTMVSGGMSPMEAMAWFRDGGGYDLAYRMVDSVNMDVQLVDNGGWMGTPEIFLSTNKVLAKAGDIKGVKVRAAGDGAEILTKMGASTVMMPAGDVFEAMERGVVDAFEVSGATLNWNLGLQDAAKYIYLSGARQPYEYNPFIIRKSTWNKLTPDLQAIISEVNQAETIRAYTELLQSELVALDNFRDYGVLVDKLPVALEEEYLAAARAFYSAKTASDPFAKEILESYWAFQESIRAVWNRV
jgi:TRAP-type mannitol/chloroaromatic compound transport system substrate-binding protein